MIEATTNAPDECPECGTPWHIVEAVETDDPAGHEGWEDWCYCKRCDQGLFYPHIVVPRAGIKEQS